MHSIRFYLLLSLLVLASCKKEEPEDVPMENFKLEHGILVLNEGLFQQNNSSVSWIRTSGGNVDNEFFTHTTGRLLGDTGNDMQRYGGKIYIVVNASGTIEVLSAQTFKSLKQILVKNASNVSRQPRNIAFHGSRAYITCYDGYVDVLDTASLTITNHIAVGPNPEALTFAGGYLFVTNSGGLNYPDVDSTVSVIDPLTESEVTRLTIGNNPGGICTAANGSVYAISRGNYGSIPARMHRIDPVTLQVVEDYPFDASSVRVMEGNRLFISYFDYADNSSKLGVFDASLNTFVDPDYLSTSQLTTFYGVQYNPSNEHIYCLDAMNYTNSGYVYEFTKSGSFVRKYHVGLNPNSLLFFE